MHYNSCKEKFQKEGFLLIFKKCSDKHWQEILFYEITVTTTLVDVLGECTVWWSPLPRAGCLPRRGGRGAP